MHVSRCLHACMVKCAYGALPLGAALQFSDFCQIEVLVMYLAFLVIIIIIRARCALARGSSRPCITAIPRGRCIR